MEIDYKVTKNGTYTFKIVDNDNNEIEKDVIIDKIDTVEPKEIYINYKVGVNIFRIKMNTEDGDKTDNSTRSGIDRYEIFLNDKKIGETSENEYIITNLTSNNKYSMYVIAYGKANNLKQSQIISFIMISGEYPTITGNSIDFRDKYMLAIDAISPETFDNNYETCGDYNKIYNYYNAKAYVDKSAWGKILKINFNIWYTGSTGYYRTLVMQCYDENEKFIGYITSTNCETATTYEYNFEIPDGCKSIKFVNDLTFRIYEIKIEDNKEINENDKTYRNLMLTVSTATTIKNGVIISASDSYGNEYGAIMDNNF